MRQFTDRRRKSILQRYVEQLVILRVFLVAITAQILGLALYEEQSLNYRLLQSGGLPATIGLCALAVLALLAFADLVVNDVLPERHRFDIGAKKRDTIWLCIAATYLGYAFVLIPKDGGLWLSTIFVTYALAAAFVAVHHVVADLIERARREQ